MNLEKELYVLNVNYISLLKTVTSIDIEQAMLSFKISREIATIIANADHAALTHLISQNVALMEWGINEQKLASLLLSPSSSTVKIAHYLSQTKQGR